MTELTPDQMLIVEAAKVVFNKMEQANRLSLLNIPIGFEERRQAFIQSQLLRAEEARARALLDRVIQEYAEKP